jgi:hypothetical protein
MIDNPSNFATAEKDTSKIQIRNRQDAYNALTDRETFDKLMQQGLDAQSIKNTKTKTK